MIKKLICSFFLFTIMFLHNGFGEMHKMWGQVKMLENYENCASTTIIDTIRKDLLSGDALLQDAGCIILLKMLERLKDGDKKAELIFTKLSDDQKVVGSAAEIIDARLLGWYNVEKSEENDNNIKMYRPLFHILGQSDNKTAHGTLVRSLLYLQNHKDILEEIPINGELVALSMKMLKIIDEKLCCLYPGRDLVIAMLEKDSRLSMLDMFGHFLVANNTPSEQMKKEMKEFIVDCMKYGDAKNGYSIRINAARIAGMLVKDGEMDLVRNIEELAKNDPYYIHKYDDKAGYSMTELKYPVREMCSEVIPYK
jgi:hypothetical protein